MGEEQESQQEDAGESDGAMAPDSVSERKKNEITPELAAENPDSNETPDPENP